MAKTILICAAYILSALSGMTLIKSGYTSTPLFQVPVANVGVSLKTLLGVLLYGISFSIYVLFVSRLKISIAIPVISGIHCALTVLVGMAIFHEHVSWVQMTGIACIIIGTVLVGVVEKAGK